MSLTNRRWDPSPAWNRKLILARGGKSLLAGIWTTSSRTTANFIDAEPSSQACRIAVAQANRIALIARSKYNWRSQDIKATSISPCNPGSPRDPDRYGKRKRFVQCCRKTTQRKCRWTTNWRLAPLKGGHPLESERTREGHTWQSRR